MSRPDAAERPDDDAQAQRVTWFDHPERPVGTVYVRNIDAQHQAWLDRLPPHERALVEHDLAAPPSRQEIRDTLELLFGNLAGTDLDAAWVLAVSFCTARAGIERLTAECNATADSLMKVAGQRVAALAEVERLTAQRDAVLTALDTWRSGAHDLAGSHAALARISEALGETADG